MIETQTHAIYVTYTILEVKKLTELKMGDILHWN